jgi:Tfp pilus assembly protein PilX
MTGVERTVMNILRNEKGSALLVVLIVIVVLSILGGVLLNVLRVDNKGTASVIATTRAEKLAQMGLDEAHSLILEAVKRGSTAVKDESENVRIKRAAQINQNLQTLEQYSDILIYQNDGQQTGVYKLEFTKTIASQPTITTPEAAYSYRIQITSTGTVQMPIRLSSTKQMTIYVSDILPVFRYALATSSDGSITLNGSPSIIGDGLINNELLVNSDVQYTDEFGERQTVSSIPPFWRGFLKTRGASVDPSNIQKQIAWPAPFVETLAETDAMIASFSPGTTPEEPDFNTSIQNSGIVGMKIEEAKLLSGVNQPISEDEAGTDVGRGAVVREGCSEKCGLDTFNTDLRFRDWLTVYGNNLDNDDDLTVTGNLLVDDELSDGASFRMENNPRLVIREGSFFVRQVDRNISAADLSGEIVMLDKDGKPALDAEMIIKGNATLTNFRFNGAMYVQGDVKIIGNLDMQGVLYVTGSVDLKDMQSINPPQDEDENAIGEPLVIAANGRISMNSFRDSSSVAGAGKSLAAKPIKIRAYLYSNADVDLYGIVSSYQIIGGLYGKTVTLNALRGDFSSVPQPGLQQSSSGYYFEDQKSSRFYRNEDARLQVLYDPRLFANPPYGLPWIDDVRVYVTETKVIK